MFSRCLIIFCIALAESLLTVSRASAQSPVFPLPPAPRLTVPCDASAPRIDGSVDASEWSDAAVLFGMNDGDKGVLADKPYVAYIKSDGKQLYFAFQSKVPSVEFLKHDYTDRDSSTPLDDSWEFFFYPDLKTQDFYQCVVNCQGAIFDWYAKNVAWNGDWKIKQHLTSPDGWDAEMSIPLSELGITGDPDGQQCRLGLYFNQKAVENHNFSWAPLMGLFEQPNRMGILTFKKKANVIGVTSLGKPLAGLISPTMTWSKPGTTVAAILTDPSGKQTRKIIDTPNQPIHFDPLPGTGKAMLTIVSPPDASPDTADFHYSTLIAYDSIPVTVKLTNYPSRQQATVEVNYGAMDNAKEVKFYRVGFGSGQSPQEVQRQSQIPWEKFTVSTQGLKPGPLTCKVELLDAGKTVLLSKELSYTKEGNEPWLHNTVGISKGYVPPTYTPMKVQGNSIQVIGRKIELSSTGLPSQLTSAGGPLLAAPIRMTGNFDGQPAELAATTPFAFSDIATDDSTGQSQIKLGPLTGSLKQTISFDGLCWYQIRLNGKANAKEVSLQIPLTADAARYYQLTDADLKSLGIEEWEVAGILNDKSNPMINANGQMNLPFTPQVYLGNDQMGLSWMAESCKGWQVANDKKAIQIINNKTDNTILLKINLVDLPINLDGLTFSFGLQPTPVKPVSEWQQRFAFGPGRWPGWSDDVLAYGVYCGQDPHDPSKVVSYAGLPEPQNPDLVRKTAEEEKKHGYFITPYSEITWLSLGLPEMQTFGGDWYLNEPWAGTAGSAANPAPFGLCDTENRDYQDFIVWRFIHCWDGYGGTSVYFDLFSPVQDKLPEHKRAYVTRGGKTEYPYPILATRAIARRLYIAYKQKNPNFAVFTHASNMYTALVSFGDAWPIGEQFGLAASRYPQVLTYDRYRAFLYGYPIGVKTMFLSCLKTPALTEKTELTNYLTGLVLNHNNGFWICFINQPILLPHLRVYYSELWSRQKFLPYWTHPDLTNLDPNKFKVSGWFNPQTKKGLLMVASLSPEEATAKISLGRGWTSSKATTLTNPINPSEFGSWPVPATFDGTTAVFKPYGVLMLEVK